MMSDLAESAYALFPVDVRFSSSAANRRQADDAFAYADRQADTRVHLHLPLPCTDRSHDNADLILSMNPFFFAAPPSSTDVSSPLVPCPCPALPPTPLSLAEIPLA